MQVTRASLSEGYEGREVVVRKLWSLRGGGRGLRGAVLLVLGAARAAVDGKEVDGHGYRHDRP